MRLLLDAHALLWWLADDRRMGRSARAAVADPSSLVHVSAATAWEITIKAALGRLEPRGIDVAGAVEACAFHELAISSRHAQHAARLPRRHDDPFDRMLVAQAQLEGLTCVTRDAAIAAYGVPTLW